MKVYILENEDCSGVFSTFEKALASFYTCATRCNFKDIYLSDIVFDDDLDICSAEVHFKQWDGVERAVAIYTETLDYDNG